MDSLDTHRKRRCMEAVHSGAVGRGECDVQLTGRRRVGRLDQPQRVVRDPEADVLAELLLPLATWRIQYGVAEGGVGRDAMRLDSEMIKHASPLRHHTAVVAPLVAEGAAVTTGAATGDRRE
ncbi:hypothetical protein ABZ953_34540 [Streptomyces sp. NPDC046465]|uniref:hypothetical protein n=1 Tax=Streptomyces sp. NPDC046465 TaxID=3155810 RepID=UPI0033D2D0A4